MTKDIDTFFTSGCGRCTYFNTPQCKVHVWREPLYLLRDLILDTGLKEEVKWGFPCYTRNEKNVVMLGALKGYCCLSFFKGTLLHDPEKKLVAPGENAQIARQMRFTDVDEVVRNESAIRDFLTQAIHLEEAGIKIDTSQKQEIAWPKELYDAFTTTPKLEECFTKLTPGRRRGYLLFFQGAKQSATKVARIQKWIPTILLGKGMQD